jgi:superfamily II DNA helicase RecQ
MGTQSARRGSGITPELLSSAGVEAGMNKILVVLGLAAALLIPAGAVAKPNQAEKRAAKAQCKDERGKTRATREAFRAKYQGFSDCVRQNAAEEEDENEEAKENAAKECKAERSEDPDAFRETYGTNANGKNAFGKCVSGKASEKKAEMDAEDAQQATEFKNAAKECAAERREMGREAFAEEHGTNPNKRNAFGKCVRAKTQESDS